MITVVPVPARSPTAQAARETQQTEKVKGKVTRLGTGRQARVEVKLNDNTRLKGYIGQIAEDHFTLIDPKHGTVTPVPYAQVQQIKNKNHSGTFALGLGAAVIGGVILVVMTSLRGS